MSHSTFKNIGGRMCQGTGLYDRNAREIYTDDKVKLHTGHAVYDGVIKWDDYYGRFKIDGPYPMALDGGTCCQVEVVGNLNDGKSFLKPFRGGQTMLLKGDFDG